MEMIFFVIIITIVVFWMLAILFAKKEAKTMLDKYDRSLSWIDSNNTIKIIRELQKLNEQKKLTPDDIKDYKYTMIVLKSTMCMIPGLFVLVILAKIIFKL